MSLAKKDSIISIITLILMIAPVSHTHQEHHEGVCLSDGCKTVASRMLDMIDHSADPCQDFYQYSCGGAVADPLFNPENPELILDSILKERMFQTENNISDFFETCRTSLTYPNALTYQADVIENRKISTNQSKSSSVSLLLSEFLKNDFAPIFDVSVEVLNGNGLKFIPRIGLTLLESKDSESTDKSVCLIQFESKMKLNLRQGSLSVNLNDMYDDYLHCMKSAGVDARIERIKEAVNDLDLFDYYLEYEDEEIIFQNMKKFVIDVNNLASNVRHTRAEVTSVGSLRQELGSVVEWPIFLGSLVGVKRMNRNENVIIYQKQILRDILSYVKKEWSARDLENILLMLWAERTHIKSPSSREAIKDYCFQAAKSLLPDDVKLLFAESFTHLQMEELQKQIATLGSDISSEIIKLIYEAKDTNIDVSVIERFSVKVEDLNPVHLREKISQRMVEIPITSDHLKNVYELQRKHRKDMYSLIGQEPKSSKDCRLLPSIAHVDCCHKFHELVIPTSYLVMPNLSLEKRIPNYLNFGRLSEFVARKFLQIIGGPVPEIVSGDSWNCLKPEKHQHRIIVNSPMNLNVSISLHLNAEKELRLAFTAAHVAWNSLRTSGKSSERLNLERSSQSSLIWFGTDALSPIKAFFIRNAQFLCESRSDFNLLKIMEEGQLPAKFKVNTLAKKNPFIASAFQCPPGSRMSFHPGCPIPDTTAGLPMTSSTGDEDFQRDSRKR